MTRSVLTFLVVGLIGIAGLWPAAAAELVMYRSDGCTWCEAWDMEVGDVYAQTAEGHILPLRRIDIEDDPPADLAHITGVVFTPTFVIVDKGREKARINGYPGEAFFWGYIQQAIRNLQPGALERVQARLDAGQ